MAALGARSWRSRQSERGGGGDPSLPGGAQRGRLTWARALGGSGWTTGAPGARTRLAVPLRASPGRRGPPPSGAGLPRARCPQAGAACAPRKAKAALRPGTAAACPPVSAVLRSPGQRRPGAAGRGPGRLCPQPRDRRSSHLRGPGPEPADPFNHSLYRPSSTDPPQQHKAGARRRPRGGGQALRARRPPLPSGGRPRDREARGRPRSGGRAARTRGGPRRARARRRARAPAPLAGRCPGPRPAAARRFPSRSAPRPPRARPRPAGAPPPAPPRPRPHSPSSPGSGRARARAREGDGRTRWRATAAAAAGSASSGPCRRRSVHGGRSSPRSSAAAASTPDSAAGPAPRCSVRPDTPGPAPRAPAPPPTRPAPPRPAPGPPAARAPRPRLEKGSRRDELRAPGRLSLLVASPGLQTPRPAHTPRWGLGRSACSAGSAGLPGRGRASEEGRRVGLVGVLSLGLRGRGSLTWASAGTGPRPRKRRSARSGIPCRNPARGGVSGGSSLLPAVRRGSSGGTMCSSPGAFSLKTWAPRVGFLQQMGAVCVCGNVTEK